jgi:hypothetical protein
MHYFQENKLISYRGKLVKLLFHLTTSLYFLICVKKTLNDYYFETE